MAVRQEKPVQASSHSSKKNTPTEGTRTSERLAMKLKDKPAPVEKKKVTKRTPKAKKAKQPENGSAKAEEPKTEETEAK